MGKKILSKVRHSTLQKKHEIKKSSNGNIKDQTKKNPKKDSSVAKNHCINTASCNKPKNHANSKTINTNAKLPTHVQNSKKKQTKKSSYKSQKSQKVQKSLGIKKITVQKKKSQKIQRQLSKQLDKNANENKQKSSGFIQKNELPPLAIYRKQVPERWRQSIIRYHEAKMSNFQLQNCLPQNDLLKEKKSTKQKQLQSVRKSLRRIHNQIHESISPQIIEISSQHKSVKQNRNLEISPNTENNLSETQKDRDLLEDNESFSDEVRKVFSKSQSKSSYSYEIMSLSPSKQNSINQMIQFRKEKGKNTQNVYENSSSPQHHDKNQSSSISQHSIGPEYTVERIVGSKIKGNKTLYEIKWVGYSEEQNTLQPIKNLRNIMEMVVDFQKHQKQTFKQTLKEKQKILAQKNRQIVSKDKQLSFKTKKLEEMKKKYEELTRKVRDLQKQRRAFTKIAQSNSLKNEPNIKFQNLVLKSETKVEFTQQSQCLKVIHNKTNPSQRLNDTITTSRDKNIIIQQRPLLTQTLLAEDHQQEDQKMMKEEEERDEIIMLPTPNMLRIDDCDHGQIHSDLQLVEYSFPLFVSENHDKIDKSKRLLSQEHQYNNIQHQSLLEEYDCLKYFSSEH